MPAIDTNVLVRLLVRDNPVQAERALAFVLEHKPVVVTHLSILELVWVLMSRYGHPKEKLCRIIEALLEMTELSIQQPALLEAALRTWEGAKVEFADCFILETIKAASATPLGTFDAKLGRMPECQLL